MFSDGIIAIAITIMVLEIRLEIPHRTITSESEWIVLAKLLPHLLSYLLSFVILGIMWINHHHTYHTIRHVDSKLLWHNLHLLFWLTLVPFSTSLIGKHPLLPLSTAVYGFILFMASLAFYLSRRYALRHNLLHITKNKELNDTLRMLGKRVKVKTYLAMLMYLISIPLSFAIVQLTYICFIIPAVLSFIPEGIDSKSLSKTLFDSFESDEDKIY
ncbi:MAG: hypothetical protein K0Q79_2958 [Flavipsychrobacter sp.]|nr:hypothetical protein [Flavipsychrobacter sp.]